ncbi:hypothetical protein MJN69_31245, partial [Salmonella enterica subsp. enterica serovar Kentucky]|nr:hypothetical protein [Salmonella enterica subsp. enterica serovar Kentucky]
AALGLVALRLELFSLPLMLVWCAIAMFLCGWLALGKKPYQALQAYRIGHWLWNKGRRALAIFLQNQVSVSFQVDIHPAAKIG